MRDAWRARLRPEVAVDGPQGGEEAEERDEDADAIVRPDLRGRDQVEHRAETADRREQDGEQRQPDQRTIGPGPTAWKQSRDDEPQKPGRSHDSQSAGTLPLARSVRHEIVHPEVCQDAKIVVGYRQDEMPSFIP